MIRVSQSTIVANTTGLSALSGGSLISFTNNRIAGNSADGVFTATIPLQ